MWMSQFEGMTSLKDTPILISPKRPGTTLRTSALIWRRKPEAEVGPRERAVVTYLPEPLYDRMIGAVAILVNRMLSPVIHVNITQAAHQQLGRRFTRCK